MSLPSRSASHRDSVPSARTAFSANKSVGSKPAVRSSSRISHLEKLRLFASSGSRAGLILAEAIRTDARLIRASSSGEANFSLRTFSEWNDRNGEASTVIANDRTILLAHDGDLDLISDEDFHSFAAVLPRGATGLEIAHVANAVSWGYQIVHPDFDRRLRGRASNGFAATRMQKPTLKSSSPQEHVEVGASEYREGELLSETSTSQTSTSQTSTTCVGTSCADKSSDAVSLTAREHQVLGLMTEGKRNREIATELQVTEHTAKFHVRQLLRKMGAKSRTELVAQWMKRSAKSATKNSAPIVSA